MKYQEFKGQKDISQGRKLLYYGGIVLMAAGVLLFLSIFVSMAADFNNLYAFGPQRFPIQRVIISFILILLGAFMRSVGERGLAGSGVILDPQQARKDLSPFTDALGGMARDAVDAFKEDSSETKEEKTAVMVRCRACRALNREDAKFCDQCGEKL